MCLETLEYAPLRLSVTTGLEYHIDHAANNTKLIFGPYGTPRCRIGGQLRCAIRGAVIVRGMSDTPIQWPYSHRHASDSRPSLIICGDMVRAIRQESASAVAYHFGVTGQTVTKWRKALGVDRQTPGTIDLQRRTIDQHFDDVTRAKVIASTKRPKRNAKIAAAKRGKPRPPHVQELLRRANAKRKPTAETRKRMSDAHLRRGTIPPAAGIPWLAADDALLGTMPDGEVAATTGRTLNAVRDRRYVMAVKRFEAPS